MSRGHLNGFNPAGKDREPEDTVRERSGRSHPPSSERHISSLRILKALVITETDEKVMAALAIIGLSNRPKTG